MHYSDPRNLAFWSALYITGFYVVISMLAALFHTAFNVYILLGSAVLLFFFIYYLARFILEKYIYEKIRPIYKTILNIRSSEIKGRSEKERRQDMIERVNEHVREWEQEKKEEIDALRRLEAYRREYIGNISHELKTPIFNIQGYVLTLLDGALEDPSINRDYLLKTEKSIERMIAIVQDLEMISKLESGQLKLNIERVDIVSLSREVIDYLSDKAKSRRTSLSLAKPYERPVWVRADKNRIRQVLTNLLDNSIVYGNKRGSTSISFFDMDDHLLVEVTDNGDGISREDLPRLFERFYRTDKARTSEKGGSGLGLAIVKHIIEAHKQTINVRSTLGVGTTFAFTLQKAE
jgi:two-component system phosphate regulon sensor histidine kinase PhoR